jgi:hypothetical protein
MAFINSEDIGRLVAAAVLTPVLGLIGAKIKELLEARDVREQSKNLMNEVTDLLAFKETLQKAVNSEGPLATVPPESLATLQAALAERIKTAVTHISPPAAVKIQERHLARDMIDRLFLLHRPLVWWGWPLHALYYGLLGILGMALVLVIGDFQSGDTDKWVGVGVVFFIVFLPIIILNVVATSVDRRKFRRMTVANRVDDTNRADTNS